MLLFRIFIESQSILEFGPMWASLLKVHIFWPAQKSLYYELIASLPEYQPLKNSNCKNVY